MAMRVLGTKTWGTAKGSSRSTTSAAAPCSTAWAA